MQTQILRGTGATVSRLSLGTMTFGQQLDEAGATQVLDAALEAGINFIDCADVYTHGKSEQIVGKALKGRRDSVVLASKIRGQSGPNGARDEGLHRWHIMRGVEQSLQRLQTDCLDILYMHRPDPATPVEESLAAFDRLVDQGKVLYVGMSNHAAWQVCEGLWKGRERGWATPSVVQVPYNLIARSIDEECVAFSQRHNIGMAVYNPLAGGLLTGKHDRHAEPPRNTRFGMNANYFERFWSAPHFDAVESLQRIAADAGLTLPQLSLQWLLAQPHVDSVILGVSRLEQLQQNLVACDGVLSDDVLAACDEVWRTLRGPHFQYNR